MNFNHQNDDDEHNAEFISSKKKSQVYRTPPNERRLAITGIPTNYAEQREPLENLRIYAHRRSLSSLTTEVFFSCYESFFCCAAYMHARKQSVDKQYVNVYRRNGEN